MVEGDTWAKADQTMTTAILLILAGLFFLKIAWNILTPFVLARRSLVATSGKPVGISMVPIVEISLWLLLVFFSFFSDGSDWLHSPKKVAVWGVATIIGSYIIFLILGFVLGRIVACLKKHRGAK
jgi:hypothetical protein